MIDISIITFLIMKISIFIIREVYIVEYTFYRAVNTVVYQMMAVGT